MILWLLKLGNTMLIHNKYDTKFVTDFPSFLGHPVVNKSFWFFGLTSQSYSTNMSFIKFKKNLYKEAYSHPKPMKWRIQVNFV